ncbi:replicative DNA helicase [Paenibacillus ehimensis]|uniref:replicative DNA helicase n=1 Tax=Paenibacillus ehimensis TaxID=79264 RepID=UPI000472C422|nr:DnaB-like helicase C-terminal domain-containing protein [Paenibacillus ehimensis]
MNSIGVDEAERYVLGSVLLRADVLDEVAFLEPRDFVSSRNRMIFQVMRWLYDQDRPVEIASIAEHFHKRGKLEEYGGVTYLSGLVANVASAANVEYYANLLRSMAFRRRGAEAGHKIATMSHEDYETDEEYFSALEAVVDSLRPGRLALMRSFAEARDEYIEHLKSKAAKFLSGFGKFDQWASMWRGWLYVLAGRPSVGKTAKALQMALGIARQKRAVDGVLKNMKDAGCVLFFSQEMGEKELTDRLISNMSGISYNRIISKGGEGGFEPEEWERINKAYDELAGLPLFIMDKAAITIEEVRSIARRFERKHGKIAAIFVDYLQIMRIVQQKGEQRDQAIGRVTGAAKQMARQFDCVFVMLSQMKRESETAGEPLLSHLRESGAIEQDADVVEFLWHDPNDTEPGGKVIQSTIAKGRNIGTNRFRYLFQGWVQTFKDLDKKESAANGKTNRKR